MGTKQEEQRNYLAAAEAFLLASRQRFVLSGGAGCFANNCHGYTEMLEVAHAVLVQDR